MKYLNVPPEDVKELTMKYYVSHGTTLAGLIVRFLLSTLSVTVPAARRTRGAFHGARRAKSTVADTLSP